MQLGIYEPIEPLEKVEGDTILLRFFFVGYRHCLNCNAAVTIIKSHNLFDPLASEFY